MPCIELIGDDEDLPDYGEPNSSATCDMACAAIATGDDAYPSEIISKLERLLDMILTLSDV